MLQCQVQQPEGQDEPDGLGGPGRHKKQLQQECSKVDGVEAGQFGFDNLPAGRAGCRGIAWAKMVISHTESGNQKQHFDHAGA